MTQSKLPSDRDPSPSRWRASSRKKILSLLVLGAVGLSSCIALAPAPAPNRRTSRDSYSAPPPSYSSNRTDSIDGERLRRVMLPLLQAMDHPCRTDQVRIGVLNQNEINAANAGNCQFYVTSGLLRRADEDQLRGVLAHELAHQDLGHVAKAQAVGAGLNILSAGLQSLFPAAGALAPRSPANWWRAATAAAKSTTPINMASRFCAARAIPKIPCSTLSPGFGAPPAAAVAADFFPPIRPSMTVSRRFSACVES